VHGSTDPHVLLGLAVVVLGRHGESDVIRVVFVDDEVNVLNAMRRTMRCMKDEWNMEFLSSGPAALASLAKTPADVIVTDMRMSGMDGWEVLAEVKRLYPQTVRLVLSGYAEPGAIMRLVGSAHQYMAKPGDSDALKAAIAQTQLMRTVLSNESLALLAGEVRALPMWSGITPRWAPISWASGASRVISLPPSRSTIRPRSARTRGST
jgi:DNA-binding NarL/FixJ family response regulator